MSRTEFLNDVESSFYEADYQITRVPRCSTIDIVAKKVENSNHQSNTLVTTKVLRSLDNFNHNQSNEIHLLSSILGATPLLIAQYYKKQFLLQDETVYHRHNVNAINLKTLRKLLINHISPHKIAVRGNKCSIRLDRKKFTNYLKITGRSKNQISLDLAISRQTLLNYQTGKSLPNEDNFQRIVDFLFKIINLSSSQDLIESLPLLNQTKTLSAEIQLTSQKEPTQRLTPLQSEVDDHLQELNYRQYWFQNLPWDGLSQENSHKATNLSLFTGVGSDTKKIQLNKRIQTTNVIMKLLNKNGIWVVQDEKTQNHLINQISDLEQSLLKIISIDQLQQIKSNKEFHKSLKRN